MHILALLLVTVASLAAFSSGLLFSLSSGGLAVAGTLGLGPILVRGLSLPAAVLGLVGSGQALCRRLSGTGALFAAAFLALFPALYALVTGGATGIIQPVVVCILAGLCARRAYRSVLKRKRTTVALQDKVDMPSRT